MCHVYNVATHQGRTFEQEGLQNFFLRCQVGGENRLCSHLAGEKCLYPFLLLLSPNHLALLSKVLGEGRGILIKRHL